MKADEILPFVRYIRYLDTTPDAVFETRTAYDARMFYAVSGKGGITADETEYVMNESDALIIAPGIPYKISPPKKGTAKYIAVNFDFTQDFSHLKTPIPPARTSGFDKNSILQSGKFEDFDGLNSVLHIPNIKRIEKNLAKAEYEYSHKVICCAPRITSYFSLCLSDCIRSLAFGGFSPHNADVKTDEILSYIHVHYGENLTNKKLGEIFSFHPNHLSHMIKAHTGSSLHQYILHIRIMNAARLLEEGRTSVAEAAEKTGFYDISAFSKYFKKIMGETPIRYKNNLE